MRNMIRKMPVTSASLFTLAMISAAVLWSDDKVQKRFEKADQNHDGKVTVEEFKAAAAKPQQGAKAFKRLDSNGDGSLTPAELKQGQAGAVANQPAIMKPANKNKKGAANLAANKSPAVSDPLSNRTGSEKDALVRESADSHDQRNSRRDPVLAAAAIDRQIDQELVKNKIVPSPATSDAEFIRRLSLDVRGRIPSLMEAETFLKDRRPDKRRKLIDEFLADDEYGEHFAIVWYHRIAKPDDDNKIALQNNHLQHWLAEAFSQNRGWDGIVNDLLTASGDHDQHPETTFWLAAVNDAKQGQPEAAKATAAVSRLFLGVRLECCECHNHPFTPLLQTDFWGTAAFFAQTHSTGAGQAAAKTESKVQVFEQANFAVRKKKGEGAKEGTPAPFGSVKIPFLEDKTVEVKYLGGSSPSIQGQTKLRPVFAAWLTTGENPYFARAAVNKLWANFFGRGIVDPIDDMQAESTNTHPELLKLLAEEFAASEFDQKHLVRCICNSQVYQRTSQPSPENKSDDVLYSKMPLKIMTADMLYDSLGAALGHRVSDAEQRGNKLGKKRGGGPREEFRKFFHADADDDAGIVADYTHGVPQVLRLMNSRQINDTTAAVTSLMAVSSVPDKVIRGLYLTVLSREPNAGEIKSAKKFVSGTGAPAEGYGDLMWVLLNSSEFLFNH
jgi:hypothetical protein